MPAHVQNWPSRLWLVRHGESSGNVARALAEAGPDAISVGALTHSAGALDIGLDLEF